MRHTRWFGVLATITLFGICGCGGDTSPRVGGPPLPVARTTDLGPLPVARDLGPLDSAETGLRPDESRARKPEHRSRVAPPDWVPGDPRRWTHIILHHSATDFGNAAVFDRMHRRRQWDELGYHFVINNGRGGSDGKVEVGPRWIKQKHGAHCRVDPRDDNRWNRHGIGICLVGDFCKRRPSEAQLAGAARLMAFLMRQCNIPMRNLLGHGQVPGASTKCPGRLFPYGELRDRIRAIQERSR